VDQIECDDVISKYKNPKLIHQGGQRYVYTAITANDEEIILKIGKYKSPENPNGWDIERIENEISYIPQMYTDVEFICRFALFPHQIRF
jgi:hypothetical protein